MTNADSRSQLRVPCAPGRGRGDARWRVVRYLHDGAQ
jgi:hypothetical protein